MQLRTTDRDAVIGEPYTIARGNAAAGLQFYVAEPSDGWLAVFPNFTPELERAAKALSAKVDKLEALAEVCDAESRARLVALLADATDVIFSSDLLRAVCEITGIRNAFTSFDYLQRGEREGLDPQGEPVLVSA